jgi:hypothetical protein
VILIAIAALQATDVADAKRQLDAALARSEQISNQAFQCMDAGIKSQLKEHISDATPEGVVDAALVSCAHLKKAYAAAVTSPGGHISATTAQELADDWFEGLRRTYMKHVDDSLAKPELAKPRVNITLLQWRKCVTDKATAWSRLADEASTVGKAAVTSCSAYRGHVQAAMRYELRSSKLPESGAVEIVDSLDGKMIDVAVATVISERAKRLPRK